MSLYEDAFTISSPRTGDAFIKRLTLDGWSDTDENNDEGRLYFTVTDNDELEIYSDPEKDELVASGSIQGNGECDIDEEGASGLSGNCLVQYTSGTESTGTITVTYAKLQDLLTYEVDVEDFIGEDGLFMGLTGLQHPLMRGKIAIEKILRNKLENRLPYKTDNTVDWSVIAKPKQLADSHALMTLHLIFFATSNGDDGVMKRAKEYERKALEELDVLRPELDYNKDNRIDDAPPTGGSKMYR